MSAINIDSSSIWKQLTQRIHEHTNDGEHLPPEYMPSENTFHSLINVAFNASLQTEEKRRLGFRIIYLPLAELERDREFDDPSNRFRVMPLEKARIFEARELIQIAPVAELTRLLVCVCLDDKTNRLLIWGLLDTGESWWRVVQHQAFSGTPPPHFLTVTSTCPGELKFSLHGNILLVLRNGELTHPFSNPIWNGPISSWLEQARNRLHLDVLTELRAERWSNEENDEGFPSFIYDNFLEKVLINIRNIGHGGSLILVPHEVGSDDARFSDLIVFKYKMEFDYVWYYLVKYLIKEHEHDCLYSPMSRNEALTQKNFHRFNSLTTELSELDEKIQDTAKSIASLTSVDGAVVITTQFKVLGFGGEIVANASSLNHVIHASEDRKMIPIETFGTRHRSAFRFSSCFEDSVAFIVSSDGGVKATKSDGRDLRYWSDINEGAMGL